MPQLHIALQEGFDRDQVEIAVDGVRVFQASDVSTRQQIGLAASVDVEVASDASLEIAVPSRGKRITRRVDPAAGPYVAVSLDEAGAPVVTPSSEPFRYA
jgi:hypothetical protein